MARLRMFLACLLLVAIPLQGLAAASMMFCGFDAGDSQPEAAAPHDHEQGSRHAGAAHDHALHQHAGQDLADADDGDQPDAAPAPADSGHKCSVCAACCHSVAISEAPQVPALSPPARTAWVEPAVPLLSRPRAVPDKPPRA